MKNKMMGTALLVVTAIALPWLSGKPSYADEGSQNEEMITVVGLDENHQALEKSVPFSHYQKSMSAVFSAVRDSVEPELESQSSRMPSRRRWELRTLAVGCAVTAQIGLGPIFNISATPRLRLIFTNTTSPVYPD
jgi:hypothetical protein